MPFRINGVSIGPGATRLTRMLFLACSFDIARTIPKAPCFEEVYAVPFDSPILDAADP